MTRDDHMGAEKAARSFRTRVERAYKAGRINRRRVEQLGVMRKCERKFYYRELKDLISTILRHGVTAEDVMLFRWFVKRWIKKGAPIDPKACWIPAPSLQIIARQIATAIPSLGTYHQDAKLWLSDPLIRSGGAPIRGPAQNPRNYQSSFVPFNLTLAGGDYYGAFNRSGFQKEWIDDPGDAA